MGRNIVLYIAVSLDGFIARKNGSVDWLKGNGENSDLADAYERFISTVDTVIMGRTTYEQLINELSPGVWVYEGKKCYVATTKSFKDDKNVEFITGAVTEKIKDLKNSEGGDIWLVGGAKLIAPFIEQNLIDKYVISIIPTILGDGIPLFSSGFSEIGLNLIDIHNYDGVAELTYIRK